MQISPNEMVVRRRGTNTTTAMAHHEDTDPHSQHGLDVPSPRVGPLRPGGYYAKAFTFVVSGLSGGSGTNTPTAMAIHGNRAELSDHVLDVIVGQRDRPRSELQCMELATSAGELVAHEPAHRCRATA